MAIKTQVDALLNKKMDRQDFIKHVAIGIVAMSGAGAALRLLGQQKPTQSTQSNASLGYGSSAYGGVKEKTS